MDPDRSFSTFKIISTNAALLSPGKLQNPRGRTDERHRHSWTQAPAEFIKKRHHLTSELIQKLKSQHVLDAAAAASSCVVMVSSASSSTLAAFR